MENHILWFFAFMALQHFTLFYMKGTLKSPFLWSNSLRHFFQFLPTIFKRLKSGFIGTYSGCADAMMGLHIIKNNRTSEMKRGKVN
jgi:hypothetical protein